jgi:hypothetical protein
VETQVLRQNMCAGHEWGVPNRAVVHRYHLLHFVLHCVQQAAQQQQQEASSLVAGCIAPTQSANSVTAVRAGGNMLCDNFRLGS